MMIMLFLSIAFVVWGILMMAAQAIDSSASEGARVAARAGLDTTAEREAAAKQAVDAILAAHGMSSGDIEVALDDSDPSHVVVTVRISLAAAGVPAWLDALGFTFGTRQFEVRAAAGRE
jgi:Flp pilus assembly protein TadG